MSFDSQALMDLVGGDKELCSTLVQMHLKDWRNLYQKIQESLAQSDAKQSEYYAHRLKGNVRNFYAEEVCRVGQTIEDAGRDGEFAKAQDFMDLYFKLLEQLEKDLKNFVEHQL